MFIRFPWFSLSSYSHPSLSDLNVNPEGNLLCDVMGKENGSFQAVTFLTGENRNQYLLY